MRYIQNLPQSKYQREKKKLQILFRFMFACRVLITNSSVFEHFHGVFFLFVVPSDLLFLIHNELNLKLTKLNVYTLPKKKYSKYLFLLLLFCLDLPQYLKNALDRLFAAPKRTTSNHFVLIHLNSRAILCIFFSHLPYVKSNQNNLHIHTFIYT